MKAGSTDLPLFEHLRERARHSPNGIALIWYGRHISWAELNDLSDGFAAHLQALKIGKGEPIALFLGNCPQYLIAHYGIQKAGGVVCPISPLNKEHELIYQLNDLKARIIIMADHLTETLEKVISQTQLEHLFYVRYSDFLPETPDIPVHDELKQLKANTIAPRPGYIDFLSVSISKLRPSAPCIDMDDVAIITYTSGSTGLPKGAMLTHRNALFKATTCAAGHGVGKDDRLLAVTPAYHIAGMNIGINMPILSGATLVLLYRFDASIVACALEQYRITWWYSVTPMNIQLMKISSARAKDWTDLRRNPVASFGMTFTEELAEEWKSFAPNCLSCESAYGLSETHTSDCLMPHDAIRWGTHGKPVPGNTIRIVDPNTDREMPPDEPGEIRIFGPGNFKGYLNNPVATAQTLQNGWVHTGDIGKIDQDGYLTFLGRLKEMIKTSGYSVMPEEIEIILLKHANVEQVAIVGRPDPIKGEAVVAFVVLKKGFTLSEHELKNWAKENMAPYKVPREIQFLNSLPTTSTGKILRRLLPSK